ncbi:MAG: class I SAM-dependent methyltransferase, partial [Mangrovicoccus sp.]
EWMADCLERQLAPDFPTMAKQLQAAMPAPLDPALGDEAHYAAVKDSLDRVAANRPTAEAPRLVAGFSPNCVDMVAQSRGEPYSFAFIDGWHEDNGPQNDAEAVIPYMADDAIMVFHDLSAPAVFQGLRACENSGWKTGIYNTTQIMGVASRGNVRLPDHVADPAMPRPPFPHLQGLPLQSI